MRPATSKATVERVLDQVEPRRQRQVADFLEAVVSLGCWIETPHAVRQDYVNIQPPRACGAGRLCSVTRSTGRIEFQTDTYALAESIDIADHFTFLAAGAKAAITPDDDERVEMAIMLAKTILAARRGRA